MNAPAIHVPYDRRPSSLRRYNRGKCGSTMYLNVRNTWVALFQENEYRLEASLPTWTDQQISEFMQLEFPKAKPSAYRVERVRMYRSTYNAGSHSFKACGEPTIKSYEYDSNGVRVTKHKRSTRPTLPQVDIQA